VDLAADSFLSPSANQPTELLVSRSEVGHWKESSRALRSWDLTPRQLCDLELIMNGAFSPLRGFLTQDDYDSVVARMRLANGSLWPIPITLDVGERFADSIAIGDDVALRDPEGVMLAVLRVASIWRPDPNNEAQALLGTLNDEHPGVHRILNATQPVYVGGPIVGIEYPQHLTFPSLRHTPKELRRWFTDHGWHRVVAFQTRNPMHRAHVELALRAACTARAALLLHPAVGTPQAGDIDPVTRMRCYQHVVARMPPEQNVLLSALSLAMRMAGPREALWHAIVRKNYGCTHFIVGRDHAGPGKDARGVDYYAPYAAQELVARHEAEIGIELVAAGEMLYSEVDDRYVPESEVRPTQSVRRVSATELRRRVEEGVDVPTWLADADVVEELRKTHPLKSQRGFTIFFTGLSGSGKSTIARALFAKLGEQGGRPVTLLDGDVVRKHLSSELGFSREHRNLNVMRIGYVASEITKHRGIAICAPIAPYTETRRRVRTMISEHGGFFEVFVSTPLEVCEARDRKGLYAKARAGLIEEFTGISDPYEPPTQAELVIDTRFQSASQAADLIIACLSESGYWQRSCEEALRAA
jgi:sulfate adenylyltransferase